MSKADRLAKMFMLASMYDCERRYDRFYALQTFQETP